jgi:hypothetical protein
MDAAQALSMVRHHNPRARYLSFVANEDGTFNAQIVTGLPNKAFLAVHDSKVLPQELEDVLAEFASQPIPTP